MNDDESDPRNELTRRQLLLRAMAGAAALVIGDPLQMIAAAAGAGAGGGAGAGNPNATRSAAAQGRVLAAGKPAAAKSVIQIWMWGGPSHLDTFDPKPEAGYDYCGPLNKPAVAKGDAGARICELLPMLAAQGDKFSILRSVSHGNNGHETASYIVQTGREPDRLVYPGAGAVTSLFRGYENGYAGIVPPYIVLSEVQGRFSEAGFLGQKYKPFATGGDPNRTPFVVEGLVAQGISDERQRRRRALLHSLDTLGRAMHGNEAFKALEQSEDAAYEMMFGKARKVFDLSGEKDSVRDDYGRTTFGQSCLLARRLVEQGVPFITINYKGWDTHKQHFEIMRRRLPEMDRAMATLLRDLAERGLLESTIVWWGGEFGRTPKVQWEAPWNGGRGHFGACFSSVLAGGGFKGGRVVGASNRTGEEVAERRIAPREILASIYTQLGIDPAALLPNPRGLEAHVLPPPKSTDTPGSGEDGSEAGRAGENNGILRELLA